MSRWPACISCAATFIRSVPSSKSEGHYFSSCPNAALPYPPSLPPFLQGSCTPLMVATLHPPSAGIAPQYSLPLGLGTGVGRPTLLEHTATVLVKQRWPPRRKTCTRPLPLTMPSLSCPTLPFSFRLFANFSLLSASTRRMGLFFILCIILSYFPSSHADLSWMSGS